MEVVDGCWGNINTSGEGSITDIVSPPQIKICISKSANLVASPDIPLRKYD